MGCTNSKSSEVMSRSGGNTGVGGIREATSTSNATTKNIPSIPDEVADLFNHNNNPAGIIVRDKIEDLQEATTVITDTVNTIRSVSEELNEIVSNDVSPKQQESHGDGHTLSLDKSVKSAGSEEDGETLVPGIILEYASRLSSYLLLSSSSSSCCLSPSGKCDSLFSR